MMKILLAIIVVAIALILILPKPQKDTGYNSGRGACAAAESIAEDINNSTNRLKQQLLSAYQQQRLGQLYDMSTYNTDNFDINKIGVENVMKQVRWFSNAANEIIELHARLLESITQNPKLSITVMTKYGTPSGMIDWDCPETQTNKKARQAFYNLSKLVNFEMRGTHYFLDTVLPRDLNRGGDASYFAVDALVARMETFLDGLKTLHSR